jgi:hypothetical protein
MYCMRGIYDLLSSVQRVGNHDYYFDSTKHICVGRRGGGVGGTGNRNREQTFC